MATLARLKAETDRLKTEGSRRIFVSSDTVQAYRVAHDKKELLNRDSPLILSLPPDASLSAGSSSSLMIDASVGPQLRWTLTSVNHILRTVSKWGEPTYLFANILDTDPQAFVAVTLSKGTSQEELDHLESVLKRVSQYHVTDRKPVQVPDAGDVLNALGKGLMGILGIKDGGKTREAREQHRQHEQQQRDERLRQQQLPQRPMTADEEQDAYLSKYGGGSHVAVHGRPTDNVDDARPSAPVMFGAADYRDPAARYEQQTGVGPHGTAAGVRSKQDAEDRIARLKAEMAKEGPPAAPQPKATAQDTLSYAQRQQQQRHTPGVLDNPYTSRPADAHHSSSAPSVGPAAATGSYYPNIPTSAYDSSSAPYTAGAPTGDYNAVKYEGASGKLYDPLNPAVIAEQAHRHEPASPTYKGYEGAAGRYDSSAGYYDSAGETHKPATGHSGAVAAETNRQLQEEAQRARYEWEQAQREAEQRANEARYGAAHDNGGWGGAGSRQEQQQRGQAGGAGKQQRDPPDWLEVLGKMFGGGPAYNQYAPDL